MIEVEALRKEYGDLVAVDDVTFRAEPEEIFGLLGPNGAGKSTTIGCISGLLAPTAGRVRVMGHDVLREPRKAKAKLGIVPQELALYEDLSARENLAYWGAAYGLSGGALDERVTEVLEIVGLLDRGKDEVEEFSGGMKRRLNFGCGIVHRPEVLLLDEPTVGVDPQSRVRLLDLVRHQADAGTCVLYTTHYMEEAQALCDRLAIIDGGELIARGTLEDLRRRTGERDVLRLAGSFDPAAARRAMERLGAEAGPEAGAGEGVEGRADRRAREGAGAVEVVSAEEELLILSLEEASRRLARIFDALEETGAEIRETTLTQPSLESLFIELTGRELRE